VSEEACQKLVKQWDQAKGRRAVFDSHWEDVHRYAWPNQKDFQTSHYTQGERKNLELFDETLLEDVKKGSHVLEAVLSRRGTRWASTTSLDENLKKIPRVREYFKAVDDVLYAHRETGRAACYSALHQTYRCQLVAGNDALWVDHRYDQGKPVGIRYKALDLRDVWCERDWQGFPAVLFRRFVLNAEQVGEQFDKARVPSRILEKAKTEPFAEVECLTVLRPNPQWRRDDPFSKRVLAVDLLPQEKVILEEGGYDEMPLIFSSGEMAPGEFYGRGVAMDLLPAAKTLNRMVRDMLSAGEKKANPPLLSHDDGVLGTKRAVRLRAGALTRGGVTADGKPLVMPLYTGADIGVAMELVERLERRIAQATYVDLFTLLVEKPQMTATEILERSEEKGVFLGPVVGDQQAQKLAPMTDREIGLHAKAGRLPQMPPELREAGGWFVLEYETPAAQFQRAGEIRMIEEAVASAASLGQLDPRAMEVLDLEACSRKLAELRGIRGSLVRDERAVRKLNEQTQPQREQAEMAEAMPGMAKGVRDLVGAAAEAQAIGQGGKAA
jgi:hypothetical protein